MIVDEAYIDFAGPNASCVPLTKKYDNVIVVQTFSKSHNLAGARVGFCVANPELIADMNRIKFSYSPYNVNSLSQLPPWPPWRMRITSVIRWARSAPPAPTQ